MQKNPLPRKRLAGQGGTRSLGGTWSLLISMSGRDPGRPFSLVGGSGFLFGRGGGLAGGRGVFRQYAQLFEHVLALSQRDARHLDVVGRPLVHALQGGLLGPRRQLDGALGGLLADVGLLEGGDLGPLVFQPGGVVTVLGQLGNPGGIVEQGVGGLDKAGRVPHQRSAQAEHGQVGLIAGEGSSDGQLLNPHVVLDQIRLVAQSPQNWSLKFMRIRCIVISEGMALPLIIVHKVDGVYSSVNVLPGTGKERR